MLDYTTAADTLTDALHLDRPPVGLAFVGAVPETIPPLLHSAPSACSLWRSAEQQTFYAAANAHLNCPVGAMVMGFELPESTDRELSGLAELMVGCGYLGADEVSRIPTVKSARAGIVYGPLRDFPVRADLIVMWVSSRDAMLYAEAAGSCAWTTSAPGGLLGRPACAALPTALQNASPVLSLGCAGMRTFTEIRDHRLMAVLPAQELDTFVAALAKTVEANATMQRAYDARRTLVG
jgi:uncharacterized protein (DUF169 family)